MVDTITIVSPNGGEIWLPGSTHIITWLRAGTTLGPNVKIELWKGGVFKQQLVYAQPGSSFTWIIPSNIVLGTDYKIFIMGCTFDATGKCISYPTDMSNATFSISSEIPPPVVSTVTVVYPNGGESLTKGSTYDITWSGTNIYPHPKIELYKGGIFNRQIVYSSLTINKYTWTVPTDLVAASDYKIRIMACAGTDTGCSSPRVYPEDMSNANFSIVELIPPPLDCPTPVAVLTIPT